LTGSAGCPSLALTSLLRPTLGHAPVRVLFDLGAASREHAAEPHLKSGVPEGGDVALYQRHALTHGVPLGSREHDIRRELLGQLGLPRGLAEELLRLLLYRPQRAVALGLQLAEELLHLRLAVAACDAVAGGAAADVEPGGGPLVGGDRGLGLAPQLRNPLP
jgi:hypothetical protein